MSVCLSGSVDSIPLTWKSSCGRLIWERTIFKYLLCTQASHFQSMIPRPAASASVGTCERCGLSAPVTDLLNQELRKRLGGVVAEEVEIFSSKPFWWSQNMLTFENHCRIWCLGQYIVLYFCVNHELFDSLVSCAGSSCLRVMSANTQNYKGRQLYWNMVI